MLPQNGRVRAWDDASESKHSTEFDVEFGIECPPASLEIPHPVRDKGSEVQNPLSPTILVAIADVPAARAGVPVANQGAPVGGRLA